MMEERIIALLTNDFIPVLEDTESDIFPCITFHFYNEDGALYAGGNATEETASCQIDFWYKAKTPVVMNAITVIKKAIMNKKTFSFPKKESLYETDTKIHHTYLTFDLIKESGE
jgi:hypothetical protein